VRFPVRSLFVRFVYNVEVPGIIYKPLEIVDVLFIAGSRPDELLRFFHKIVYGGILGILFGIANFRIFAKPLVHELFNEHLNNPALRAFISEPLVRTHFARHTEIVLILITVHSESLDLSQNRLIHNDPI
jgi:hypothetical protein